MLGCVDCVSSDTQRLSITLPPVEDRVARGKRLLEQSMERVKRVRREKKKITLQHEFLKAQDRLDSCVYALQNAEEKLASTSSTIHRGAQQNIKRLQDKRQLFLLDVIKAEEAILDFDEEE